MNMKEAYQRFDNYIGFIQPESLYDLETIDTNFIDSALHGKINRIREDSLGQPIRIGDLVAYSKIGGTCKGISKGIVLGYTDSGYRVARIHKDPGRHYYFSTDMQTPGSVILVKTNRKYL